MKFFNKFDNLMSNKQTIIQVIANLIVQRNNEKLQEVILNLPSGQLQVENYEKLFSWLLELCYNNNNIEAGRIIISHFDVSRAHIDPTSAVTNLVLNSFINSEVLRFAMACFPEKEPTGYFIDLINMGDDFAATRAAGILAKFFPSIKYDEWSQLLSLTDDVEDEEYLNHSLRSFFQNKVKECEKSDLRPSWILTGLKKPVIPEIPKNIPSVKEAIDLLTRGMKDKSMVCEKYQPNNEGNKRKKSKFIDFQNNEDLKDILISQYSISTFIERIQMLDGIIHIPIFDDKIIFQEFGPVNTIYLDSTEENGENRENEEVKHICEKYGGCRMLLCKDFELEDINGEECDSMSIQEHQHTIDWFRGKCDFCKKKILCRHYAIRIPLWKGGWKGCYCGFSCLESQIDKEDTMTSLMIGRMKEQLSVIGIRDR